MLVVIETDAKPKHKLKTLTRVFKNQMHTIPALSSILLFSPETIHAMAIYNRPNTSSRLRSHRSRSLFSSAQRCALITPCFLIVWSFSLLIVLSILELAEPPSASSRSSLLFSLPLLVFFASFLSSPVLFSSLSYPSFSVRSHALSRCTPPATYSASFAAG